MATFFVAFFATFLAAFLVTFFAAFLATFFTAFFLIAFLATFFVAFLTTFLAAVFLAAFLTVFFFADFLAMGEREWNECLGRGITLNQIFASVRTSPLGILPGLRKMNFKPLSMKNHHALEILIWSPTIRPLHGSSYHY